MTNYAYNKQTPYARIKFETSFCIWAYQYAWIANIPERQREGGKEGVGIEHHCYGGILGLCWCCRVQASELRGRWAQTFDLVPCLYIVWTSIIIKGSFSVLTHRPPTRAKRCIIEWKPKRDVVFWFCFLGLLLISSIIQLWEVALVLLTFSWEICLYTIRWLSLTT